MQCPDCEYMMSAFDTECPRCAKLGKPKPKPVAVPTSVQLPAARNRSSLAENLPAMPLPTAPSPRTIRNVTPEEIAPSEAGGIQTVYIIEKRSPKMWPILISLGVVLIFGGLIAWHYQAVAAENKAMFTAAEQGFCDWSPDYFPSYRDEQACYQLTSSLAYSIVKDAPDQADVTMFLNGSYGTVVGHVAKDNQGDWRLTSLHGNSKFGTRYAPPPEQQPADPVAAPLDQGAPPSSSFGDGTSSSLPPSPDLGHSALPSGRVTGAPSVSGNGQSWSMQTKAGGGDGSITKE